LAGWARAGPEDGLSRTARRLHIRIGTIMTRWGRWLRLGTLLAVAGCLWSCVAPILTVPPPGTITFTPATVIDASTGAQKTVWTTQGGPIEQASLAQYSVINQRLGSGVIATAQVDGSFTAPAMDGVKGDPIVIYYRTPSGDYSDSTCVLLSEDAPASCR
jgi:hypothetical protein